MKKLIMFMLIPIAVIGMYGFKVQSNDFEDLKNLIVEEIKESPSKTVYGVVENTKEKYVVNTPLGKYDIEKKDGGFSCFGIYAKIQSTNKNKYIVESSLGDFVVDTKKCIIIKK